MNSLSQSVEGRLGRNGAIRVRDWRVGSCPEAEPLNTRFRAGVPLLKLQVEIDWKPRQPETEMKRLLSPLLDLSPSLRRHACRGEERYRILAPGGRGDPSGSGAFEAPLALAHLIEHLIIDIIGFVLEEPCVSGATGAPAGSRKQFDIFVECSDPVIASPAILLSVGWISRVRSRQPLNGLGRTTLEVARHLYRHRPAAIHPHRAARELHRHPGETGRALDWLERAAFARRVEFSMNFSAEPHFRVGPVPGFGGHRADRSPPRSAPPEPAPSDGPGLDGKESDRVS